MKIETLNGIYHIHTNPAELLKIMNMLICGYDELANGFEYVIHNTDREENKECIIHIAKNHPVLSIGGFMYGNVENHPELGNAYGVSTSRIISIEGDCVQTKNTRYRVDRDEV